MSAKLERLVTMGDTISKGRYPNVQTFCTMFEVQPRTVYEDIRSLKERMGMEVAFDRYKNGYYNKNPNKQLPAFELTNGEIFALTIGKDMLSSYTGTSFEPILKAALEKIYARLPEKVEINIEDLRSMIRFKPVALVPVERKMFLDLNRACEKNLPIQITYYSPSSNETTDRKVDPYRLVEHRCTWYVVAWCHLRRAMRMFALHRIGGYRLVDARFTPLGDEEVDTWLNSAFLIEHGDAGIAVKIRFNQKASRYIRERQWHSTQVLTEHPDGSCTLAFTTQSLDEVQRWVLGYGEEAEVTEPEELRRSMKAALNKAVAYY
jgi:predicted DNA-binding transcriptional regulator YafY